MRQDLIKYLYVFQKLKVTSWKISAGQKISFCKSNMRHIVHLKKSDMPERKKFKNYKYVGKCK